MAELAEQTRYLPQWLLAEQAYPELDRRANEQTARQLGSLALAREVRIENIEQVPNESTLLAAIQLGALGDETSRRVVRTNVATDIAERLFKAGHQTKIWLEFSGGRLLQDGRQLIDIHKNTLQFATLNPVMERRAKTELKNALLFQELLAAGALDEYDIVVFSPCPEDVATKKAYGFFADTDSCSIQMLRKTPQGIMLETALVAGKRNPTAARHDIAAIQAIAKQNNLNLSSSDGDGMLNHVLLVPRQATPRGVSDVVAQFDQAAGGTFYGQAKPRQNYEQFAKECQVRNDSFVDTVEQITAQLLKEAHAFTSPMEVLERLDYLSERFSVARAKSDLSIDAAVFGDVSARHIVLARRHYQNGDYDQANKEMQQAKNTANSTSCPLFKEADGDKSDATKNDEKSGKKWMSCPYCQAKVFDDPCAQVLACWDCKAIVVNGRVKYKGDGGSQKRQAEQAKHKHEAGL
ncbi:MAG: hypothetical protein JWS12_188 [Candidatus Saccharibacteria bacterium]|nr:hypothetical protein [Candidatus Saccharibacteria bacterium]